MRGGPPLGHNNRSHRHNNRTHLAVGRGVVLRPAQIKESPLRDGHVSALPNQEGLASLGRCPARVSLASLGRPSLRRCLRDDDAGDGVGVRWDRDLLRVLSEYRRELLQAIHQDQIVISSREAIHEDQIVISSRGATKRGSEGAGATPTRDPMRDLTHSPASPHGTRVGCFGTSIMTRSTPAYPPRVER